MENLLDLEQLARRLREIDSLIISLALRRMEISKQVGQYKLKKNEPIVRLSIEDKRINEARTLAKRRGLSEHFAESLLYLLINESCKVQLIQREESVNTQVAPKSDDEHYTELKRNLLRLTERISESYDERYASGFFATREYLRFEEDILYSVLNGLAANDILLDLGCATGRVGLEVAARFGQKVIGFDISQHMISQANQKAEKFGLQAKARFQQLDMEDGIPIDNESVGIVVMNLGTASDVRNIDVILSETLRVLRSGGHFLFSFYNKDALLYRWEFLPWAVDLAASVNIHRQCLEVHLKERAGEDDLEEDRVYSVYARPYTCVEVVDLFQRVGMDVEILTFPTIGAILPHELFEDQPATQEAVTAMDLSLSTSTMGAYIIATGQKK